MIAPKFRHKLFLRFAGPLCASLLLLLLASVPALAQTSSTTAQHHRRHATGKLDINTATLAQLEAIPGLGAVYAKRIVAGRPYTSKRQLKTRGILPQNLYMQVKDRLIAHRPKKKS